MEIDKNSKFYKWLKANFIYGSHKRYHPLFEELITNMHENTVNGFRDQFERWNNNALGIHQTPQYSHVKAIMEKL